jgi:hypothetical protein
MKKIINSFMLIAIIGLSANGQLPINGLVAYYPFNGNANDSSSNGNNGTVFGATLTSDRFGNPNSAYSFNGINNYISLQPANNFVGFNNYTISLWAFPTAIPTNSGGMLWGIGANSTGYEQGLTYQTTTCIFAGSYNIGNNPIQSYSQSCDYNPNRWVFITVTRDSSYINMYINGKLIAPQSKSLTNGEVANYGSQPYAAIIGGRSNLGSVYFFKGKIDEFRMCNKVLSD